MRGLLVAVGAATLALALWIARYGTVRARLVAVALLVVFALLLLVLRMRNQRRKSSERRLLRSVFGAGDPVGVRLEQALLLLEPARLAADGTSRTLAELHLRRMLKVIDTRELDRVAQARARWIVRAAWALALTTVILGGWHAFALIEGANVLCARGEVAPLEYDYVTELAMQIRPPDYLRAEERRGRIEHEEAAPKGSLLTLRAEELHPDRALFLSDGDSEVPFVDDGSGQIVARYPLERDVTLRIVARFGDVRILDPIAIRVHAVLDRAPDVVLEDAPRTVRLLSESISELQIRYTAEDDHGLREVHLVMRSGTREDRRTLARLDGNTRSDRGGYVLHLKDSFIARSYAPIEVTVEAKDNDPLDGPKWGKSAAITLIPPEVGEPEALRIAALRTLRDRLVDSLASALEPLANGPQRHVQARALWDRAGEDEAQLISLVLERFGSLRLPSRLTVLLQAQNGKMKQAAKAYLNGPSESSRAAAAKSIERFVLVVDAVLQGRAMRDARAVARKLSEVADDLTSAERILESTPAEQPSTDKPEPDDPRKAALARAGAAKSLLDGGGRWLSELGSLGRDLGEITGAYGKRVVRAEEHTDYFHAALAAADLAARLAEPDPSFQSEGMGGGGGYGGGEAGATSSAEQGGEASEVERAFQEAAAELGNLVEQHAQKMAETERDADGKPDPQDLEEMREELQRHAEAVRKLAQNMQSTGNGASKSAEAREQAEQMAKALESGNVADAVQNGQAAENAANEAKQRESGAAQAQLEQAAKRLAEETAFAGKLLDKLKKKAQERGKGELGERGNDEAGLAERMRALSEKAGDKESLPEGTIEALRAAQRSAQRAAEALRKGDGERGLNEQRDAQRSLERAKEALGREDDDGKESDGDGNGDSIDGRADIPKADAHKGPDAFRQRVMRGLGQAQGKNRDAVQRYAEGLVR